MAMKTPFRLFTDTTGRTWAVRFLPIGARYGRDRKLTVDAPTVEFYDTAYADDGTFQRGGFGPLGQFVQRYDVATILGHDNYSSHTPGEASGLVLDGGVPAWRIDAETMTRVREWLAEHYVPRVVMRPRPEYGEDFWTSVDGEKGVELVMTCRYVPRYPTHFSLMWVGPKGEARREQGGPVLPGPFGDLVAQSTVISAYPLPRPATVKVAAGQELDLVLVGDGETEDTATVARVRITDDRRLEYPRLEVCE